MKTKLLTTMGACALAITMTSSLAVAEYSGDQSVGRDSLGDWKDPSLQGVTKEIYKEMNNDPNYPYMMHRAPDGTVTFEPKQATAGYIVTRNVEGALVEQASDGSVVFTEVTRYKVAPEYMVAAPDGRVIYDHMAGTPTITSSAIRRGDAAVVYESVSVLDASGNVVEPDLMLMSEEVVMQDGTVVREGYLVRKDTTSRKIMSGDGAVMRSKTTTYKATPTDSIRMNNDGTVLYEETTGTIYRYRDDMGRYRDMGPVKYVNEYEIYRGPETR